MPRLARIRGTRRGRRSRSSSEIVVIIMAIILAIAVFFAVILPPLLPLLWLLLEVRDRDLGVPKSARAFALTREEWDELEGARARLAQVSNAQKVQAAKGAIKDLAERPVARWKAWVGAVENVWGNRVGLAAGFACFALVLVTRATPMNTVYAAIRSDLMAGCNKLIDAASFKTVSLMLLPLVAWLIGALVGWSMGVKKAERLMPEPAVAGQQRSAETELADESAREELYVPIGGSAAGLAAAAGTTVASVLLMIAALLGRI